VEVLRDGQWLWLTWQQINVGDVVRVRAGAFFPADLILISSRYGQLLAVLKRVGFLLFLIHCRFK
jgi:magnesium-transporting ATPase (P-type)